MPPKISLGDFLVDTKGSIWIIDGMKDSLHCYKNDEQWKSWEVYPTETKFRGHGLTSIVEGENHSIYITSNCGLFQCINDRIYFITAKNLVCSIADSNRLTPIKLFKDKENTLFLLQSSKENVYQISQLVNKNRVGIVWNFFREVFYKSENHTLRIDNDNTIWQLTTDAGLGPIFNSSATSKLDSTLLLFPNEGISDFVIDREGNYWISSLSNGVHIIPSLKIQQYTADNSILKYDRVGLIEKKDSTTLFINTEQGEILSYNINENIIEQTIMIPKGESIQLSWWEEEGMLLINGKTYQEVHNPSSNPSLKYEHKFLYYFLRNSVFYKKKWLIDIMPRGISLFSLTKNIGAKTLPDTLFFYGMKGGNNKKLKYYFNKSLSNISSFYGIADEENDRVLITRDDSLMCYPENALPFAILDRVGRTIRGIYMERGEDGIIWICTVNSGLYALDSNLNVIHHFTVEDNLISNELVYGYCLHKEFNDTFPKRKKAIFTL